MECNSRVMDIHMIRYFAIACNGNFTALIMIAGCNRNRQGEYANKNHHKNQRRVYFRVSIATMPHAAGKSTKENL